MSDTPRTDEVMMESSADAVSAWLEMRDHARKIERELKQAQDALREMIGILEENIARRAGTVQPGGGNLHEAMLLAKWRVAAGMDTANAGRTFDAPKETP